MSFRASVSTLDQFRQWREEDSYVTLESLLATIRGEYVPVWQAGAGEAFHAAVAHDESRHPITEPEPGVLLVNGWKFSADDVERVRTLIPAGALDEVTINQEVRTARGPLYVTGRVDYACGLGLVELKTTWSYGFDFDRWAASAQWRFYLLGAGARSIRYHVCEMNPTVAESEHRGELREVHTFDQYPYPALADYCQELAADFLAFCAERDLLRAIRRREAA